MSLKEEPESDSKRKRSESPEFTSTKHEHTDFSEESSDHEHKNKSVKSERATSPAPSYMSLKTDWSMEPPTNLKKYLLDTSIKEEKETITISTNNQMDSTVMIRVKSERAPSPTLSLWSDFSVEPPAICKAEDTFPLDSSLLTSHHLKCPVCKSLLKDPVSISCGHNCCRGCINEFWDNCAGDFVCPQCGNPSETRPVLSTNTALAEVVKNLQQAGFSPALPLQSYAGPEDVACDFCTEQRLKAVKCCLTCVMSLCETHVRQHYTIPALQKHTLSDVPGDMKTKPSEEHQNTDSSFTVSGQQEQTDKTQDVIEEQVRSISESALNICTSEMAVNKDTDVRSLALLCSKLQQEVSGLKKSLSNLNEKKTKKEKYFDEDYGEEDDDYDVEDYSEKDSDAENDEEEEGDEDYFDDPEGYTDDEEEEKEDSCDDEEDNTDDYNEDYDDDYNYSEDDKDEEDNEDDEDEDYY
ncbi:hypothetical protein QQF64_031851 [Cirrhinus molitorella]|uniref:RING-type domain-containing protein n=1 Tax=Cirrhinus molitorella TaxID=172907 RepID=A0ABR3MY76_9TELE